MEKTKLDYYQLISFMKELRMLFHKEYGSSYKLGNIYKGNPDYSYFSLTPEELKKQKLKFVIILNHKNPSFSICLSGQNKNVRKKYWILFQGSDWSKYRLAESIDDSLSIVDYTMVKEPDFSNKINLTQLIKKETLKFIEDLSAALVN